MAHAEVAAMRSHDSETQVGCVLVDSTKHTPSVSACNGFASGVRDHTLPNIRPDKYKYMIHSEINMLAACARDGTRTEGKYLVCTHSPCVVCMRAIYQSGIKKVIVKEKYKDFQELKEMLDLSISESTTEEGYTELTYGPKKATIVVVGSNPSSKSFDCLAFDLDTSTGKKVRSWFNGLNVDVHYTNVSTDKTLFNRKLTADEVKKAIPGLKIELNELKPDLVVSVGGTAKEAIRLLGLESFHMPHPSGKSRFWNDETVGTAKVKELRDLISTV
jgi:dCMP deaminase